MRLPKSEKKRERGSVLAMSALGMLAFLLATGMAVDIGHFYLVKSELQNAADAAALAGASALNSRSTGITEAVNRATAAMNSYEFNSKSFQKQETELMFIVTAHLVKPVRPDDLPQMRGVDGLKNGSPLGVEPKGEGITGDHGFSTGDKSTAAPAAPAAQPEAQPKKKADDAKAVEVSKKQQ